jgi:hypothetical protein
VCEGVCVAMSKVNLSLITAQESHLICFIRQDFGVASVHPSAEVSTRHADRPCRIANNCSGFRRLAVQHTVGMRMPIADEHELMRLTYASLPCGSQRAKSYP